MPLINSAILAAVSVAIALPIGTLLAVLLTRFQLPGNRIAAASLGVLLLLPLYVQLSAWDAALGKLGWHALVFGSIAEPFLSGMRGAIFVHGIAAIPWVTLIISIGLSQVDPAQEEAALLVAPPRVVIWRITLAQSLAAILAAAVWTAVGTTSEMTVTNIYLIDPAQQTYTERLYMSLALTADASQATVEVLPGIVGLAAVVGLALWMVLRMSVRRIVAGMFRPAPMRLGAWRPIAAAALWFAIVVLVGVPLVSLIVKAGFIVRHDGQSRVAAWSLTSCALQVAAAPQRFARELSGTALVAAGAAAITLACALPLAWRARRGGWAGAPAIVAIVLGLAIPGPLVGVALIQVFNHDVPPAIRLPDGTFKSWLLVLYDHSPLVPMLAQSIRALPLAVLLLRHSFATLPDHVLEVAALDGLSPKQVFWRIVVPQRWRSIAAAWLASFAVAAGDLAWAHLVTPPGLDLLSRRVFGLVHSGVEEQVAAISLLMVLLYTLLALVVWKLLRDGTRASRPGFD